MRQFKILHDCIVYCIREANKVPYDFEKLSLEDWVTTSSFSSTNIKLIKCTNACHHIDVQLTVEIVGDDIPALLLAVVVPEAEVKPEIGAVPLPPVITGVTGVTHPTGVPHPPVETTIIYTTNGPLNIPTCTNGRCGDGTREREGEGEISLRIFN